MKTATITEAEVQKSCLELLKLRGVLAWRSNSRVFMVPGKKGRERPMRAGLGKGSSDIIGILPGGRCLAVEVKRPGKKPTLDQILWLRSVNAQGGLACWVADVDVLSRLLDLYFMDWPMAGRTVAVRISDVGEQSIVYPDEPEAIQ